LSWLIGARPPATEFDVDRGAASYHLRQMARFGFVDEDTARSAGRRLYWRAVRQDMRLPDQPAENVAAAALEIGRQWLERSESDLSYLSNRAMYGQFAVAAQHSFGGTSLTVEELTQFGAPASYAAAYAPSWIGVETSTRRCAAPRQMNARGKR
jgi:hypothetical protein